MTERYSPPPTPESQSNQESEFRQRMLEAIAADSAGTVGLLTTRDFSPEQKQRMLEAQSARGGEPSKDLSSPTFGWGDYGERVIRGESSTSSRDVDGERVRFVDEDDGTVDVRYSFARASGGYTDDTNRPGNVLNVHFKLPAERASELREALRLDPSFINEVIKTQLTAIGVDTGDKSDLWRKMEPNYESIGAPIVKKKDRVLKIMDVGPPDRSNPHGNRDIPVEDLVYGEGKSLAPMYTSEAGQPALAEQPAVAEQPALTVEQAPQAAMSASVDSDLLMQEEDREREYVDYLRRQGKTLEELIATYDAEVDATERALTAAENEGKGVAEATATYTAAVNMLSKLKSEQAASMQRQSNVEEARAKVEEAHKNTEYGGLEINQHMKLEGQPVVVTDLYKGKDANSTEWATIRGEDGNERTVKVSDLV